MKTNHRLITYVFAGVLASTLVFYTAWQQIMDTRLIRVTQGSNVFVEEDYTHPDNVPFHSSVAEEEYILSSNSIPARELWPEIGNGHLATVVYSDTVHMNCLYNGYGIESHRARIPAFLSFNISIPDRKCNYVYSLNLARGIFIANISCHDVNVTHLMYAHREVKELLVSEVLINKVPSVDVLGVKIIINQGPSSGDLEEDNCTTESRSVEPSCYRAASRLAETDHTGKVEFYVYYDVIPPSVTIDGDISQAKWVWLMSAHPNPTRARNSYNKGGELAREGKLLSTHTQGWYNLWQSGRVDVHGDVALSRIIYSSFYYILSSIPSREDAEWPYCGISPTGLAHGGKGHDYLGHIFWDQETWIYPAILLLHTTLAKTMLNSRLRLLNVAKLNAFEEGWKGAKFPWESAFSGTEVTSDQNCSKYEIHVNGDIAIATHQYYHVTRQTDFIELSLELARFWKSRLTYDSLTGLQYINGVMGPDEYHYPVNNSAYTNSVARKAMEFATFVATFTNYTPANKRNDMSLSDSIWIPYDPDHNYNPEFTGYTLGHEIKQADVVLLQYPLMIAYPDNTRRNNLHIYENATNHNGPAMTWSVFAIDWLELQVPKKAHAAFKKSYINAKGPFLVWAENPDGSGAFNFLTGMGGFHQSLLFGFGGFRILADRLEFDPVLLPGHRHYDITGVKYMGGSFNLYVRQWSTVLTVTSLGRARLYIEVYSRHEILPLVMEEYIVLDRGKNAIFTF